MSMGQLQASEAADALRHCTYLVVAARGSSDNAALFLQYFAGQQLGRVVTLATSSLYESERAMDLTGAGVIGISQSGRSPGIARVLEVAQAQGRPTVGITNDNASPLAQASQVTIALGTGPEVAVASTKTFTASWCALVQLVSALGDEPLDGIAEIPQMVEEVTQWALDGDLGIERFGEAAALTVVGRGVGFAVACEIALKIREVSGLRAESYAVSDYLHGPVGADGERCVLLVVVTDELSDEVLAATVRDSQAAGMLCVFLRPASRTLSGADAEIVLPFSGPNWLVGLGQVIIGQVLALRIGEYRGRPIDTSPRLRKVTLSA